MEITRVKERMLNVDMKTKILLFLGIVILTIILPKNFILALGLLIVLVWFSKGILSVFLYLFSTAFRVVFALALLLFALYVVMILVVYFFT